MTDSLSPTNDTEATATHQDDQVTVETEIKEAEDTQVALDAAYAQSFTYPTSLEASPDGNWLVWLQPDADDVLCMWLSNTAEGSEPFHLDLDFTPIEDRDPETGRLLRGPQFSPDSTSIAVTGLHPDGDRTSIWIVPLAADLLATIASDVEPTESDNEAISDSTEAEEDAVEVQAAGESETEPETEAEIELTEAELEHKNLEAAQAEEMPGIDVAEAEGMVLMPTHAEPEDVSPREFLLVDHAGADRSPRWSPDGIIIAFTSTVDGRDVIALGSPQEPGGMEMLTWSRDHSREPQWSRSGQFIAFLRPIGGGEEYHDIWSFSLEVGELTNLTGEKSPAVRHSIEWVPGRNLIAFVTEENDWLGINVVNADNKAGWVVTRESGDKTEPRFADDEARLIYVRTEGFSTVLCERSLHSSASIALDPGEGVASMGRWCGAKRVAYGFSAPQQPFNLFVQDNTAKAERTLLQPSVGGSIRELNLVQPEPLEFKVGPDETFSGLMYKPADSVAGAVYLPEGPLTTRRGSFQVQEQAMASAGIAVLSPVLHGASGFGSAIENDLREFADTELEITDIAEAARELGKQDGLSHDRIALVGDGFGGALALVTAGARPGSVGAVVAINPIVDWTIELANADIRWREWVADRLGMPLTDADAFALRTPATFTAVIDCPIILVRTADISVSRSTQFDLLTEDLNSVGVAYTLVEAPAESYTTTLRRISRELAELFSPAASEAEHAATDRAGDI